MNLTASQLFRMTAAGLLLAALVSCSIASKGPGGTISKVKYYHLQPTLQLNTTDPAILFEREHHLRGAYTAAEQLRRSGHYYAVLWKAQDVGQPVSVKLEYQQAKSGSKVKSQTIEVADVGRSNVTKFQVTGDEYQADGPVNAWKVSLLRGKEELASQKSFLWK